MQSKTILLLFLSILCNYKCKSLIRSIFTGTCTKSRQYGTVQSNQVPESSNTKVMKSLTNALRAVVVTSLTHTVVLNAEAFAASTDTAISLTKTEQTSSKLMSSPLRGFQTKSGLKYFDIVEGNIGESPRYGDLVSFYYTSYYKATPETSLDFIDSSYVSGKKPFLHKHGNGRIIRGIDEALHTMKVGGKRRIIVPKAIGYSEFGLGPLPEDGSRRKKLGALLDLLDKDQGELVVDLELVLVAEDENDQGYYDDVAVSQDEVRQLVLKSLQSNTPQFLDKLKESTPKNLFKK